MSTKLTLAAQQQAGPYDPDLRDESRYPFAINVADHM